MKAGFYELDITPFIGMERPGGYIKSFLNKIHDPLKIRVLVCEGESEKIGICVLDTLVIPRRFVEEIREEIGKKVNIKGKNILISATHTHSGGPLFGLFPDEYEDAPELIKELISKYSITVDPYYYEFVKRKTIDAIYMADLLKEEVLCQVGIGFENKVSFNRRSKMKNNKVYTHPGKGNPDIIGPAGPVDYDVGVLSFWDLKENFKGCLINFACHCTTGPDGISADWIYYTENVIKKLFNEKTKIIVLQGASGDITQVDNFSLRPKELEYGEKGSNYLGTRIGLEALKIILTEDKYKFNEVKSKSVIFKVKIRKQSEEKLKKAEEIVKRGFTDEKLMNTTEWIFAKERLIADYLFKKKQTVEVEIQAVQIGPVIIVSNPGEFFCILGKRIKENSHFPFTFVVELANGCIGYIPNIEAFSESEGGYETVLTSYSNLEINTGEKIVEESIKLIKNFKPEEIPFKKSEISTTPWSYGVLGPDVD
ncbi:MAG: hypothetical protein NC926_00525 [Candidatus Omnitrophica bacterium]|nr:hypothetical protein [Candidatus Omnitrophota bacterium]MCM8806435.1 hypothetical protein [Candidatus Omnitrophota bacterium]